MSCGSREWTNPFRLWLQRYVLENKEVLIGIIMTWITQTKQLINSIRYSLPSLNRICTLYTLEEAKRFSLVKMSATDMNSLVPIDRDLEYTIESASDIRTKYFCHPHWWKQNNFVANVILRLELYVVLLFICTIQWILGWSKTIDSCDYSAVELSVLSQENLWKLWSAWKPGVLRGGCIQAEESRENHAFCNVPCIVYIC